MVYYRLMYKKSRNGKWRTEGGIKTTKKFAKEKGEKLKQMGKISNYRIREIKGTRLP